MKISSIIAAGCAAAFIFASCTSSTSPAYDTGGDTGGGGGGGGPAGTSFRNDVLPILSGAGCTGCHGVNGGLTVTSVAALLAGGDHGPAVVPGDAASSNLVRKLSPTPPFGSRMPLGGPYLPDASVGVIRAWINEGALDN